jgi:hypothetical protein
MSTFPMDRELTITASPDAVFQEVEGEAVLLHLAQGKYFGLDEVGTRIWQLLEAHGSAGAVLDRMLEEFDVEPERLESDLDDLLQALAENGLVTLSLPER